MPDMFDSKLPATGRTRSVERSEPAAELVCVRRFLAVERSTGDSVNFTVDKISHCRNRPLHLFGELMNLEDLAKRVREACLEAIIQAYEDAGIQGLCAEGRWEIAVGSLRTLDLTSVLRDFQQPSTQNARNQ